MASEQDIKVLWIPRIHCVAKSVSSMLSQTDQTGTMTHSGLPLHGAHQGRPHQVPLLQSIRQVPIFTLSANSCGHSVTFFFRFPVRHVDAVSGGGGGSSAGMLTGRTTGSDGPLDGLFKVLSRIGPG